MDISYYTTRLVMVMCTWMGARQETVQIKNIKLHIVTDIKSVTICTNITTSQRWSTYYKYCVLHLNKHSQYKCDLYNHFF